MMTGGVMSAGDDPNVSTYTEEEVPAAVEEVHRHKKKVTVHAHGAPGINTALRRASTLDAMVAKPTGNRARFNILPSWADHISDCVFICSPSRCRFCK